MLPKLPTKIDTPGLVDGDTQASGTSTPRPSPPSRVRTTFIANNFVSGSAAPEST